MSLIAIGAQYLTKALFKKSLYFYQFFHFKKIFNFVFRIFNVNIHTEIFLKFIRVTYMYIQAKQF